MKKQTNMASQMPKQIHRAVVSGMGYFSYTSGAKVVWLAPSTRTRIVLFVSSEIKGDGNEYAVIHLIPGSLNEQFGQNDRITIPIDQLMPYELL